MLLDSNRQPLGSLPFRTIYDPVALTITITGPDGFGTKWLEPGQTYHFVLPVADDARDTQAGEDVSGVRAIDREPLAAPREYTFRAGPVVNVRRDSPPVDFCADVMPLFATKCGTALCHHNERAIAGLILNTSEGVRTAINRVAHGANTGRQGDTAESATRVFGINMPLITPFDPGSSWLMYKIELAPRTVIETPVPNIQCTPPPGEPSIPAKSMEYAVGIPGVVGADSRDRAILNDYVLGREMPYPVPGPLYAEANAYTVTPLTFQERERIRVWIADGAQTRDCGGCGIIATESDAGADASP